MELLETFIDFVMWLGGWILLVVVGFIGLIMVVFYLVRAGTAGYLSARQRYSKGGEDEQDGCSAEGAEATR